MALVLDGPDKCAAEFKMISELDASIKSFQETVHIIKKVTAERDLSGSFAEEKISADDLESEY